MHPLALASATSVPWDQKFRYSVCFLSETPLLRLFSTSNPMKDSVTPSCFRLKKKTMWKEKHFEKNLSILLISVSSLDFKADFRFISWCKKKSWFHGSPTSCAHFFLTVSSPGHPNLSLGLGSSKFCLGKTSELPKETKESTTVFRQACQVRRSSQFCNQASGVPGSATSEFATFQ